MQQSTSYLLHLLLTHKLLLRDNINLLGFFFLLFFLVFITSEFFHTPVWISGFFFLFPLSPSAHFPISRLECVLQTGEASFNCPEIAQVQPSLTTPYRYKRLLAWKTPQPLQEQTHRETYCTVNPLRNGKKPAESVNNCSNTES